MMFCIFVLTDLTTCPVVCKDGWVRFKGSCYLFSTLDKVRIDEARVTKLFLISCHDS